MPPPGVQLVCLGLIVLICLVAAVAYAVYNRRL